MKYIKENNQGITDFSNYFPYLTSIKNELADDVYSFFIDEARYDLSSKSSLHDSWIKSLLIKSPFGFSEASEIEPDVRLVLLGPYHDRDYVLSYFGLQSCDVNLQLSDDDRKKDLLIHEGRIEDGYLVHELLFDGGMTLQICCESMHFAEVLHVTSAELE